MATAQIFFIARRRIRATTRSQAVDPKPVTQNLKPKAVLLLNLEREKLSFTRLRQAAEAELKRGLALLWLCQFRV